jgi:hypothetical protein
MVTVRALRGVCIGVDRHLARGDVAEIDADQLSFLRGIGAVEEVTPPLATAEAAQAAVTSTAPAAASAQRRASATTAPATTKQPGKKEN